MTVCTMANVYSNEDVDTLLRAKGLRCVCQLCDCGRYHKHLGCKVQFPTVAVTMEESGGDNPIMQSDYNARFPVHELHFTLPVRHEDEMGRPRVHEAMEFSTTQQTSYKKFDNPEVRKPCKLKGEIDKLLGGEFHDKTNYKDSFVEYKAKQRKTARPSTVVKIDDGSNFNAGSEYRDGFQEKKKIPQEKYAEKPGNTYAILHPDFSKLPKNSVKNSIHDGQQCERVKPCDMRKPNIDFGLNGEFDHTTTNGVQFKDYDIPVRRKYKRGSRDPLKELGKFEGISQNSLDFKYDEKEAMLSRGKRVTEPPSLITLSMDMPQDFKTVSTLSYHGWKPNHFRRPQGEFQPTKVYTPATEKFEHHSHTHHDYVNYGATPRTEIYHPPEFQRSSAKVGTDTSYRSSFKQPGKPERKFHGEYHSANLQLPAADRKFAASSTMRSDYQPMKIEKRPSFKPASMTHMTDEKISTATEYNEKFLPMLTQPCNFTKYLTAHETGKIKVAGG